MDKDKMKCLEVEDGMDGSVYITIKFADGSKVTVNPDVCYDGPPTVLEF